jgi:hypothetical protein
MGAWIFPGGGTPPAKSAQDLLNELYPLLGASSASDLVHWTDAELLQWANDGLKRLARRTGVFVERGTVSVSSGTAAYTLPTRHLSSIHVSLDAAHLRPSTVAELEALSTTWITDSDTPDRYVQNQGTGVEAIRLYAEPDAGGTLAVVHHQYPAEVTAAGSLPLPEPVADYLFFYGLGEARRKESDGAMPEVSELSDGLLALYEQVCQSYWGVAQ